MPRTTRTRPTARRMSEATAASTADPDGDTEHEHPAGRDGALQRAGPAVLHQEVDHKRRDERGDPRAERDAHERRRRDQGSARPPAGDGQQGSDDQHEVDGDLHNLQCLL